MRTTVRSSKGGTAVVEQVGSAVALQLRTASGQVATILLNAPTAGLLCQAIEHAGTVAEEHESAMAEAAHLMHRCGVPS